MVILIPARGGSKRVPRKNMVELWGKPLLWWTVVVCRQLGMSVFVSSEDAEIGGYAEGLGVGWHRRGVEASSDEATDWDVLEDFGAGEDVLYMRPTTPLRDVEVVRDAVELWNDSEGTLRRLRGIQAVRESSQKRFFCRGGLLLPVSGEWDTVDVVDQAYEQEYEANGYVDIFRYRRVGSDFEAGYETEPVVEVDTEWDLRLLRGLGPPGRVDVDYEVGVRRFDR